MGLRVFIVAGDRSGDIHAARLMAALRDRVPDTEFVGIGGPAMHAVGLKPIVPLAFEAISVSGFSEVVRRYRTLRGAFEAARQFGMNEKFDVFIPVDYPGFNLPLARQLRSRGVPVFWYIAPQLWAWGQWRAARLAAAVDRLFVILPFEVEFFQRYGIEAEFHGHPLLDNPRYAECDYTGKQPHLIALLPGWRQHERALHLQPLLHAAVQLRQRRPELEFAVGVERPSHGSIPPDVSFESDVESLLLRASIAIVKAGTTTLEALLAGAAQVVVYRASLGTYVVGRLVVRIPYIALPNIIAGKKVVPEIVQWTSRTERIEQTVMRLLDDPHSIEQQRHAAEHIRSQLGRSGTSGRIADRIVHLLARR